MAYALDYIDVAQRIADFRAKHPEGALQPADPAKPYTIENIDGQTYIVVVAAAYRSPDDSRPGIGMAYEIFPGKTNFTRGSELQNAETSAWGRAIVAALAGDTKKGIASAEEVRNRKEEQNVPDLDMAKSAKSMTTLKQQIVKAKNLDDLNEVTKQIMLLKQEGVLASVHLRELQEAWKVRNAGITMAALEEEITKVETQDEYDKLASVIGDAKIDEDAKGDLIRKLDTHIEELFAAA